MDSYELQTINKDHIPLVFREEAKKIAQKMNEASEQVAIAKKYAESANSIKLGGIENLFGGQTKKKTEALGNAAVKTNEALIAMGDLIQESIKLTCRSADAAINMSLAIASIMEEGFEDKDGKICTLSDEGKKNMNAVREAAIDFVKKQDALKKDQALLQQKLDEIDKVDTEQNERLEGLQRDLDEEREKARQDSEHIQKIIEELKTISAQRKITLAFSITASAISLGAFVIFIIRTFL
ncbi:MAG: hypothetical protein LBD29_00845 [Treponema sp.]|jgi:hypothetical protein|nr:hypothetical protein [Treponema sp.]